MLAASRVVAFALIGLIALPGCTALQELAALRSVTFAFAGVSDVRLAGIRIGAGSSYASLTIADATRLGAAIVAKEVPLELVAHVDASNPAENKVSARMAQLGWTLFVEDRQALTGQLGSPVAIAPGQTVDVPLAVRFDLALAISGQGSLRKDLRLELIPTIETSLGPIRYPTPVVVHRAASR